MQIRWGRYENISDEENESVKMKLLPGTVPTQGWFENYLTLAVKTVCKQIKKLKREMFKEGCWYPLFEYKEGYFSTWEVLLLNRLVIRSALWAKIWVNFYQKWSAVVILINATTLMHQSTLSTSNFGNNHFGQKYQKQNILKIFRRI